MQRHDHHKPGHTLGERRRDDVGRTAVVEVLHISLRVSIAAHQSGAGSIFDAGDAFVAPYSNWIRHSIACRNGQLAEAATHPI
jgi:hypothetical protein